MTTNTSLPTENQIKWARSIIDGQKMEFSEKGTKLGMLRIMLEEGRSTVDELVEHSPVKHDPETLRKWAEEVYGFALTMPTHRLF